MGLNGHIGPLRGHNPIFSKFSFTLQSSLYQFKWALGGLFSYFNPLNRHYLYPPFFRNTKAKEEKFDL